MVVHVWRRPSCTSKCYVVIEGTAAETRRSMFSRFGHQWSHQYGSAEAAGVERWV